MTAFDRRLRAVSYEVAGGDSAAPVRLVLLTDLHACDYGPGQGELLAAVEAQAPDVVLLGGDIADDAPRMDPERAYEAVRALAARWPTYYVTGNHEIWSGQGAEMKARFAACGAVVLAGERAVLDVRGRQLSIAGVDDPAVGEDLWRAQLAAAADGAEGFSILLTHRPERVERYRAAGFDLVLAGHAHGGQWRVPGLINGILAPDQGLFPKYAGGQYDLGGATMVVSRGLARESTRIPRLFNPPELTVINVR